MINRRGPELVLLLATCVAAGSMSGSIASSDRATGSTSNESVAAPSLVEQTGGSVDRSSSERPIAVHAADRGDPWVKMKDGRSIPAHFAGHAAAAERIANGAATPLALTTADFDEDGMPDLVASYATDEGGYLTLHRGNIDALYPNTPEARARRSAGERTDAPFHPEARLIDVWERPDFIAAGDFDADGHQDLVSATHGADRLAFYRGDGRGSFAAAEPIDPGGRVTAMTSGEINRRDGLADLVVGVDSESGARALIFDDPGGSLRHPPESISLPAPAIDLTLMRSDNRPFVDLTVATARDVIVLPGRDRRLYYPEKRRQSAPPAAPVRYQTPFTIVAMTIGDFDGDRAIDVALLDEGGTLHIGAQKDLEAMASGKAGTTVATGLNPESLHPRGVESRRDVRLLPAKLSTGSGDDLLLLRRSGRRIDVRIPRSSSSERPATVAALHRPDWIPFEVEGDPVAVLPMRLNGDARSDLVVLAEGTGSPATIVSDFFTTFVVSNTNASGAGSLFQAVTDANATAGADVIWFNIPGSGPHTIQDTVGLPAITESVLIDATSEPDFSGLPVVELDASLSPASHALEINADMVTIRGLVINGASGSGIHVESASGVVIEGNLIGTNASGTGAVANLKGISAFDTLNLTVGGTAFEALNLISGNTTDGIRLTDSTGPSIHLNFIGTDIVTGSVSVPNDRGIFIENTVAPWIGGASGTGNLISGNTKNGIEQDASSTAALIQSNFIGSDIAGTGALGNGWTGIELRGTNNQIGGEGVSLGNQITSQGLDGILIDTGGVAASNQVAGNRIGVDYPGTGALGNGLNGIAIVNSNDNAIGGSMPAARNIISGNGLANVSLGPLSFGTGMNHNYIGTTADGSAGLGGVCGIYLDGSHDNFIGGFFEWNTVSGNDTGICLWNPGSTGNHILENFIGTDPTGSFAVPNGGPGIDVLGCSGNEIGVSVGHGNIISGNAGPGVLIRNSTGIVLRGNLIGIDKDDTTALPNGDHGVHILGGSGNVIGGAAGYGNVISGNPQHGLFLDATTMNDVRNNLIGLSAAGSTARPNGMSGVHIDGGSNNSIGLGNRIAFNSLSGVAVVNSTGNAIRTASIHSNGGLAIDLGVDGVNSNDPQDPDIGPNMLQNFPVLSNVTTTGGMIIWDVSLNSTPSSTFNLDFYTESTCDPSGHGEGRTYIVSLPVPTDASGNYAQTGASWPAPLLAGEFLTAIATDAVGNTSEFSACSAAAGGAPLSLEGLIWDPGGTPRIEWEDSPGAFSYNVYMSAAPNLQFLSSPTADSCQQAAVQGSTALDIADTLNPPLGQALWWIVRPVGLYGEGDPAPGSAGPRDHVSTGLCGASCAHDKGIQGGPLDSACDPCVAIVCENDPACCSNGWSAACVEEVRTICGSLATAESQGACQHPVCTTGAALQSSCDEPPVSPSCVKQICGVNPACCTDQWDTLCVEQVATVCNKSCL